MATEPMDKLKAVSRDLVETLGSRATTAVSDKVSGLSEKFEGMAEGGPAKEAVAKGAQAATEGKSPVGGAVKGLFSGAKDKLTGGGGGGGGTPKATKATRIIEQIDVGVPRRVAYNQWTEFGQFPSFMKKVENVEAEDDHKLKFKAQIVWSHRSWEATIKEQIPDERIVWRSKGEKGHVDGAVTFHELGPNLTRILLVLEYYPQGLFERTGNIWRAQGRRARVELKNFQRHVMTRTILNPDDVEGWRGEIRDSEVVKSHDEAAQAESDEQDEQDAGESGPQDEVDDQPADEEDEYDDESEDDEDEGVEDEDVEDEDEQYDDEEPEDVEDEEYDAADTDSDENRRSR